MCLKTLRCECRSVFLDSVAPNGSLTGREMTNDPQLPQGFYPVDPRFRLLPGREIQATCDFDSSERSGPTSAGSTHHDEMCNLYLLTSSALPFFQQCMNNLGSSDPHGAGVKPPPPPPPPPGAPGAPPPPPI